MTNKFNPKFIAELLKRLPAKVFWKDIDGVYLGCNDAFVQSLGLSSQEEIIGQTDFTLPVKIKEAAAYRKDDLEVIKSNKPKLDIVEEQNFPDGKKAYLLTSKVPLSTENSGFDGILGIYSDITELKLTQEQLKLEKEKAEVASKSKSEFIANMSHDLRTPITGMLGMVQDMVNASNQAEASLIDSKESPQSHALKNMIETVRRDGQLLMSATDELLQLCNEILDVVDLESGKIDNNLTSFSLPELIEHNMQLLQPLAAHKLLQLSYHIDQHVPQYLSGHRIYLDRILLNLMSNALKFTKEGAVTITATLLNDKAQNHQFGDTITLQISVKDTGIGIPKDKFEFIFEHFSRLTPAYESMYKGAGLGLYTVKHYVKFMQGQIDLESELEQGSCFTVTLPFIVSDHSDQVKQSVCFPITATDTNSRDSQGQAASILIVEDQPLAARALSAALEPFHCHVEIARSGAEALELIQENHFALILLDIGLPDLSGIEVAKKIRALADLSKSQVPIFALTGHANNPEMRQAAIDAGMQDVTSKPVQPVILEAILQNHVFNS